VCQNIHILHPANHKTKALIVLLLAEVEKHAADINIQEKHI